MCGYNDIHVAGLTVGIDTALTLCTQLSLSEEQLMLFFFDSDPTLTLQHERLPSSSAALQRAVKSVGGEEWGEWRMAVL